MSDFVKYFVPVVANDVIASVGWSMYSVIMGHLGSDVVAANSIAMVARPAFIGMSNLTETAEHYLHIMLYINAYYCMGMALNSMWISAIFRAGGDTKFGFLCDTICLWVVVIPIGFILAFVFHVPPMWVYFFLLLDEFFKTPFCIWRYRKYKWLQNITKEYEN